MFENNTLCQLICSLLPNSLPPIGRNQCICEIAFLNLTTKNNLALITENEFIIQIEISDFESDTKATLSISNEEFVLNMAASLRDSCQEYLIYFFDKGFPSTKVKQKM